MARNEHSGSASTHTAILGRSIPRRMLAGLLAALCFAPHVQAQQIFAPNMGAAEQPTGDRSYREAVDFGGHGVVLATGNKIETDVDFAAQGEMALYLQRTYNHHWTAAGLFGRHWLSNFDYSLAASTVAGQEILWVQRPDGRRIKFVPSGQAARWNEDKPSPIAYVVRNGDGTYTLRNEERGTEKYGSDGRISERRNEHGIAWTFSYAGDYLSRVTHSSGAFVEFEWSGAQLVRAWDPARRAYNYSYTNDAFGPGRHRLAGVQLPGLPTTAVGYHYEDSRFPGGLTGKSYNATRYSTVEYDANGRVFATMLAGGVERYEFTYTGGSETPIAPPPLPPAPGDEGGGGGWCEYQSGSRICFQPRFAAHGASGVMASMGGLAFGSVGAATAFAIASSAPFSVTEKNPHGKQIVYQFENDRLVSVSRLGSAKSPPAYRERQYDVNGYEQFVSNFVDGLTGYVYDAHGHLLSSTEGSGTPSTPKGAINAITLTNGPTSDAAHQGASYVAGNRTSGEWNTQSPGMGQGEAMHETLHLVGGQDHYTNSVGANGQRVTTPDSGWSGNLSAQIPGAIDNRNMSEISAGANGAQNIRIKEK